ncbi:hypothetical protein, partial [Klebsiella pneumoniae]
DRIILERHLDIHGERDDAVLRYAWINSHHQSGVRNLMDQAVVRFASELPDVIRPVEAYLKIDELPFDFVRRRLSV